MGGCDAVTCESLLRAAGREQAPDGRIDRLCEAGIPLANAGADRKCQTLVRDGDDLEVGASTRQPHRQWEPEERGDRLVTGHRLKRLLLRPVESAHDVPIGDVDLGDTRQLDGDALTLEIGDRERARVGASHQCVGHRVVGLADRDPGVALAKAAVHRKPHEKLAGTVAQGLDRPHVRRVAR